EGGIDLRVRGRGGGGRGRGRGQSDESVDTDFEGVAVVEDMVITLAMDTDFVDVVAVMDLEMAPAVRITKDLRGVVAVAGDPVAGIVSRSVKEMLNRHTVAVAGAEVGARFEELLDYRAKMMEPDPPHLSLKVGRPALWLNAAPAASPDIEQSSTPSDAAPSGGQKGRSKKKRPTQASRVIDPSQQEKESSTPEVAGASVSAGTTTAGSEAVTVEATIAATEELSLTDDSRPTEIPSATDAGPSAKGKSRKKKGKAAGQPSSGGAGFVGYQSLPHRPDTGGTIGEPVRISVNCWNITIKPMDIHVYFLEAISLDLVDSSGNRKELRLRAAELRAKLRHVVETMPPHPVYDGAHALYTDTPLPGITSDGITKEIQLPDPMDAGKLFLKYRILLTQKINTQDLIAYLDNPKASTLNMPQVFKAFFTAGCMADVLYDKYGDNMMRCVKQMEDDLLRIRAQTNSLYKQKTNRVKRITVHGLSRKPASELIIPELNQSVASYFETKYGIRLKYPELPCVKSKKDKEEYFPMELLDILPFQAPKASKADVASQVIRLAAVQPRDRFREIHSFLSVMLQSGEGLFNKFGVKVSQNLVKVTGRILPLPKADFGRGDIPITRGKWNVPGFITPGCQGNEIKWALYSVPRHREGNESRRLVSTNLPTEASKLGLRMRLVDQNAAHIGELEQRIRGMQVDIVVLILHDEMNYPEIKRLSDLRLGVRTQCVRYTTLRKPRVMPNLLLKINGKLGGVNWIIPELKHDAEHFMVFGADVTHPAPTQAHDLQKSVAAVTGSVTPDLMRYAVVVRQQQTRRPGDKAIKETITELEACITELLRCYHRVNNRFPSKLMFYRDGVSDGQFSEVLNTELPAIQRACFNLSQGYEPGITYIVVKKRHHLRFMPEKQTNKSGNVEPGTVVDKEVVHHVEFDFYLCSAEGIQGTSRPAHYHVLYDDSDWSSDALQAFTYYLCHTYMRCSRSVSYPAPTYYSHLAAYRAREWLTNTRNLEALVHDNRFNVHESQVTGMFYL
ncbi:piwi domain protein, partial [Opisthorchis viverrini]